MQDVTLAPAFPADIPVISELAERIWFQHYPSIIGEKQIRYMLQLMYNENSLREQMTVKGHLFFLIRTERGNIGFLSVNPEQDGGWFINKFYVDQQLAGNGIGTAAFQLLVHRLNPQALSLTVNRQNFKSINFYFKLGFKITEIADFDIGHGYQMNDFIMSWKRTADVVVI